MSKRCSLTGSIHVFTAFLTAFLPLAAPATAPDFFRFKLFVEQDGVYRLPFEALQYGGSAPASDTLKLTSGDDQIPIFINDGGDGYFGPGDDLEFVGQHLRGTVSDISESARYNVYWLEAGPPSGARMAESEILAMPGEAVSADSKIAPTILRLERQQLRTAVKEAEGAPRPEEGVWEAKDTESWFWQRLTHLDSNPFRLDLRFNESPGRHRPYRIRVGLTGLSADINATAAGLSQHRVELRLDGHLMAAVDWNDQSSEVLEARGFEELIRVGENQSLEISVPRRSTEDGQPIIDVALLNWIETEQPLDGELRMGQQALSMGPAGGVIPVSGNPQAVIYSQDGRRVTLKIPNGVEPAADAYSTRFEILPDDERIEATWYLVPHGHYLSPSWVVADRHSDLASKDHQADYLMIAHGSLLAELQPLAVHHRESGLSVAVIDVEDIYDEFGHGLATPLAIRDFIAFAYDHWQPPAPRYVLLVGDASWNIFTDEPDDEYFARRVVSGAIQSRPKRRADSLAGEQIAQRNLIPTLQVQAHEELAASDNGLVSLSPASSLPDLAVGRLPVAHPGELSSLIGKLLAYAGDARPGPWRRRVALISDSTADFQESSEELAGSLLNQAFLAERIYPEASPAPGPATDQASVIAAFDSGHQVVHFLGHGGRFVWRTAPPDFRQATDLFTVNDLELLSAHHKLPLVLSMTCSSGPFDHPTASSMAEAMLSLPDRGAVAVLAASWRVPATVGFSRKILAALIRDNDTVGEAVLKAKRQEAKRYIVESYNLFGDPAMRLALPRAEIPVQFKQQGGSVNLGFSVNSGNFEGSRAVVDWLDAHGRRIKTDSYSVVSENMTVQFAQRDDNQRPRGALVYVWNAEKGWDGIGMALAEDWQPWGEQ